MAASLGSARNLQSRFADCTRFSLVLDAEHQRLQVAADVVSDMRKFGAWKDFDQERDVAIARAQRLIEEVDNHVAAEKTVGE
jgi:hypothetical protein